MIAIAQAKLSFGLRPLTPSLSTKHFRTHGEPNHEAKPFFLGDQVLYLRENLWKALASLREKKAERVVWIDAICINQADTSERNYQVQQMRRIYRGAKEILIWLGKPLKPNEKPIRDGSDDYKEAAFQAVSIQRRHSKLGTGYLPSMHWQV
jgi:hypothetical protein